MNLINKFILRCIKENGYFIDAMDFKYFKYHKLGYKNVFFNSCYIDAIITITNNLSFKSLRFDLNKLKKILEDNEIVLQKKIIVGNFNDENIIKISNYFDKNGIIWGSGNLFSDRINEYFKNYNKNDFYILIDNGFCSYGSNLNRGKYVEVINADDFIPYFEEIKNNFNNNLKKILL